VQIGTEGVLKKVLHEGGHAEALVDRLGVNVIVLLALTDTGRFSYHPALPANVVALGTSVLRWISSRT
jgi:hypothetical protein